ncbi:hypothetical protein ACHAWX_001002 [Stephanocyclus meneghinianus]
MVKFGIFKKSKKSNNNADDDAAIIAAQAAKDASVQMQMQQIQMQMTPEQMYQYRQWQKSQMNQAANQAVVHPDPPTASMLAADSQPVATTATSPVAFPETAGDPVDLDQSFSPISPKSNAESRNDRNHKEETSTIDDIFENRDANEPDEETAFETRPSTSVDDDESIVSEEEASLNTTDDEATGAVSYDEDTYDGGTTEGDIKNELSYDGSLAACQAVGNQKKFFHKDVVLHNLGEHSAGNDLVIRAMYFVPKPKSPDDVVVRIEASTVSPRDCMYCRGIGLERKMLPFVPGFEIIGTIQTLGELARSKGVFKEGQRVAGLSLNGGGNSRFISIPADRLFHISDSVKSTSAVCLLHDYMAALKALRLAKKSGSPFTGMKILITDGFSPVGQAIISLASMEGANIYCCADVSNHAYLSSLGAKCFNKAPESWLPNASNTFDVVIDNSCLDSYSSSWFALNKKGILICLSPVYNFDRQYEGGCGIVDFANLQKKWAGMKAKYIMTQTHFFDTLNDFDFDRDQYIQDMRYLTFLLEKGDLKPKIAEKVSLEDVPDAQRLMYSGKANGTIVCVPWIEN